MIRPNKEVGNPKLAIDDKVKQAEKDRSSSEKELHTYKDQVADLQKSLDNYL